MKKSWVVYLHTNLSNGKKYVGITCQFPPNKRWLNGYGYKPNAHFWSAIQKYGWDGFSHDILASDLNEQDAIALEAKYINDFNSCDPTYGYKSIGSGTTSDATKEKISKANSGDNHWTKRHGITRENSPHSKEVRCVETGMVFPSVVDAAAYVGASKGNLASCCRGERNICKGFHWMYEDQYSDSFATEVLTRSHKSRKRPVYCNERAKAFPSAQDAEIYFREMLGVKVNSKNIHAACHGTRASAGGCTWAYI